MRSTLEIKEGGEKFPEFSGGKSEVINKARDYELFTGDLSETGKSITFLLSPGIMGVTVKQTKSLRCRKVHRYKMGPPAESRGQKEREEGTENMRSRYGYREGETATNHTAADKGRPKLRDVQRPQS